MEKLQRKEGKMIKSEETEKPTEEREEGKNMEKLQRKPNEEEKNT